MPKLDPHSFLSGPQSWEVVESVHLPAPSGNDYRVSLVHRAGQYHIVAEEMPHEQALAHYDTAAGKYVLYEPHIAP